MPTLPKSDALKHLRKVRAKIPELKTLERTSREIPSESKKWERDAKVCIENVFPEKSDHIQEFQAVMTGMYNFSYLDRADFEYNQDYLSTLESADSMLESMIEEVEKFWPSPDQPSQDDSQTSITRKSNKVFVIHGKDESLRDEVKALLVQVGLEPIILSEQPSKGRTIIEKFEQHSDVSFAVALLTPDDLGSESNQREQMFRARQNVIFELGFFLGKLGRKHVCALTKDPNIEIPSDYSGVAYIDLRQAPAWKSELVRELQCAGLDVDIRKI